MSSGCAWGINYMASKNAFIVSVAIVVLCALPVMTVWRAQQALLHYVAISGWEMHAGSLFWELTILAT